MRRINMLLCGLLVCALVLPISLAEEGGESNAPVPTTQTPAAEASATPAGETSDTPTNAPTAEPTAAPAPEASIESTAEPGDTPAPSPDEDAAAAPTDAPTPEPTVEVSTEPTAEPSEAPTAEATAEPTIEPTTEPTIEPTAEPTAEPDATPLPQPGENSGLIAITAEGDAQEAEGIWRFSLSDPDGTLAFGWSCAGEATRYMIYTADSAGSLRFITETQSAHIELPAADYNNGRFTLHVGGILADGSAIWGSTGFEIASGFPGGFHGGMGGFGGGRPGGMGDAGAMGEMGEMGEMDMGFRVTPGEALTSSHASGSRDTTPYICSQIADSETAVQSLTLDSTQTQITLDGGTSAFLFANAEGRLHLMPETEGEEWQLSLLALNTLADSGVEQISFQLGDHCDTLSTRMELGGNIYAALRAQGYVSKDFCLCISRKGITVYIAGAQYSINESGELAPLGA